MKSKDERAEKRPYHKPELRIYGNVRELTDTIWTDQGQADGSVYGKPLKTGGG